MSRLIDADKLKSYFAPSLTGRTEYSADEILLTIATMPTVDAEPVVRCGECRYLDDADRGHFYCWCCYHRKNVVCNDYCSWGKKKDE